ncbi:unnamed protein product, partial [Dicrocoelium dendriticum]
AYRILYTDRPNLELSFWDTSIVDMDSNRTPSLASQLTSMYVTSDRHRPTHLYILSHLTVHATYFIRVSAVNGKGEGPPSEPVAVIVRPGLLPAPSNLTAAATSSTEIELKWKPPDNLEQNSRLLQHYQIQYAPMSTGAATATTAMNSSLLHWTASLESLTSESVNTKSIGAHLNTIVISGLKPDQLYIIAIATVSQAGPGVRNAVFCRTKKFVPPLPANLTVQAVGPTELSVQWHSSVPDNSDRTTADISGRIAYFELTWRPSNKDTLKAACSTCLRDYRLPIGKAAKEAGFGQNSTAYHPIGPPLRVQCLRTTDLSHSQSAGVWFPPKSIPQPPVGTKPVLGHYNRPHFTSSTYELWPPQGPEIGQFLLQCKPGIHVSSL